MKEKKEAFGLYTVAMVGLMAALVFAGSKLEIRIPAILGVTRIHLGNSMCLLSGFLLGTVPGGIAAGLGSFLFDVIFWPGTPVPALRWTGSSPFVQSLPWERWLASWRKNGLWDTELRSLPLCFTEPQEP